MREVIDIVGGSIAGLSAGIAFEQLGFPTRIWERDNPIYSRDGHAFLVLGSALGSLQHLGIAEDLKNTAASIHRGLYFDKQGELIKSFELQNTFGTKRIDLVRILTSKYSGRLHYDCDLEKISFDDYNYTLEFQSGEITEASTLIGADGAKSRIRKWLYPNHKLHTGGYFEIVGSCKNASIVKALDNSFQKHFSQDHLHENHIAFGILPTGGDDLTWFLQIPVTIPEQVNDLYNVESREKFLQELSTNWSNLIAEVIESTDTHSTYVWRSGYMDLLHTFHFHNMFLIGDACHPLLSMTSQGVNTALEDAIHLAQLFNNNDLQDVGNLFYSNRKDVIADRIEYGKHLADRFTKHPEQWVQMVHLAE